MKAREWKENRERQTEHETWKIKTNKKTGRQTKCQAN